MESIPAELVKNETLSLVNLVKNEAQYLCCFNSYVQECEHAEERLNAKLKDVRRIIDQARGVSLVTSVALQWTREAGELIDVDTKKEKCFNDLCINCWRQYRKGKDLAKRTLDIDKLRERSNFDIVASPIDLLGIKYHCSPNFIHFESRKSTFEVLKKALEDEENNMIGLQGLGGTGKTSMAIEVGAKFEGSIFGKVIFLVVSKLPDFKKLRGEIARTLGLKLENGEEEVPHHKILAKIRALKEKLLIVLDDVWMEFDPTKELAIPPPHLHKGCTILITTRIQEICRKMDCQRNIHLEALTDKEALSLFLRHTSSSSNLESLAQNIVEHCHGVPIVIVAVARSLKGRPSLVWKEALRNLESGESIFRVCDDDLKGVYEGLKWSYDNLKNEKAKKLLLISSLLPEDFEIPMEFLIRIGVGMGPFGEVDDYNERRRKVLDAIVELLDSSLLLNAERECVKMHDLVHEVALLIGENDVQSVIESKQPKKGLQCLFWKSNSFPRHFDGRNLEVLLWVLDNLEDLEVLDTFFTGMKKLSGLFLWSEAFYQISAPSLFPSIQSLQNIRTLKIGNFTLSNGISMLGRLPNLESLWFDDCSIIKSPGENFELELRFLRIENCKINMSNPFELIEACPKLQELTFVRNQYDEKEVENTISHKASFHTSQIYQISCDGQDEFLDYFEQRGSLSRCLKASNLRHLISEATFKQLVKTAELLILKGYGETKQKNLVPDIVMLDNRGMTNLIILQLDFWPNMQCLIDAVNNRFDVKNAFSNLVGLYLSKMGLSNILFKGHYNLCHLKTLKLDKCRKLTSIFLPSTAQSLSQLEELKIKRCDALECIVEDKSSRGEIGRGDGDNDQKSCDTLFPKFKILKIDSCDNLEIILPILHGGWPLEGITIRWCEKLKYIFDKFQEVNVMLPSLERMRLVRLPSLDGVFREYEKSTSSSPQQPAPTPPSTRTRSFPWGQLCCFKSKATSEEADVAVSTGRLLDEGIPQGLLASKIWIYTAPTLVRQLALHVRHIRMMTLASPSSNSVSTLFTLSMASVISWEELTIGCYDGLKQLVTSEDDDYKDQINCSSIFPKLQKLHILECKDLEFLFLSAISIEIKNLKSLTLEDAPQLTYVIEKYQHQHQHHLSNQNQNDKWHFDLPALEDLCLERVPKFISIGPMNYKMVSPSLRNVCSDKAQLDLNTTKDLDLPSTCGGFPSKAAQILLVQSLKNVRDIELAKCGNLISVSTLSVAASTVSLESLRIWGCHKLKCITTDDGDAQVDNNNYCSIFPTLENLEINDCEELEFVFQSSISGGLQKLESLTIGKVPELKYVVGNYQQDQQNEELHFELPALATLSIEDARKIKSICAKNYKMDLSSLQKIKILNCGIKSFDDYDMVNLTTSEAVEMCGQTSKTLIVCDSKIKEIVDLIHLNTEQNGEGPEPLTSSLQMLNLQNLSELVNICVGPKHIIYLHSLQELYISGCKKLKVIFSTSTVQSLPMLTELRISKCEELVNIVEKDYETNDDDHHLCHEPCFPNLEQVSVNDCDKLRYLFSITVSSILPKLRSLEISRANELEHVLVRQGEMKEMVMKDVLQQLHQLELIYLPNLVSLCHGIDFQTLKGDYNTKVDDCPKFSFYEISTTQLQVGPETTYSQVEEKAKEKLSSHLSTEQFLNIGETTQQSLTEGNKEDAKEIVEEGITFEKPKKTNLSSDSIVIGQSDELMGKVARNERTMIDPEQSTLDSQNFAKAHWMDESVNKELKMESIMMEPQSKEEMTRHGTQSQEEEEREGGLITTRYRQSDTKAKNSFLKEKPKTSILGDPLVPCTATVSSEQTSKAISPRSAKSSKASLCKPTDDIKVSDEPPANVIGNGVPIPRSTTRHKGVNNDKDINETNVTQDESKTKMASRGGQPNSSEHVTDDPSNLWQMEQELSCSRGQIKHPDVTKSSNINTEHAQSSLLPFSTPSDSAPSVLETDQALNVSGVQEIVEMMKLEGSETSLLEESLKTHPQLRLSTNDRSTQMLCVSYRVLIDILHILTTRTPFTITEADKRLLEEKLKDARFVGFDKDWLESIKTKVFNSDVSDFDGIQEIITGLDSDLKTNEAMLAATRNQEVKAAQVAEMAQKHLEAALQEHANVMANHTQLLKARQEILARQNQYREMIAAKNKHFGF
ncbi:uncharacterized protein LOC114754343 [Neltuma alba]|uniref:uncharacterized protein LOC114754343 n=1 Tax=Neltuma alba TaxID=207710 RepID=UPI0010A3F023|nr:uncharacterized protein LOC114754343 [Prosopis alba]